VGAAVGDAGVLPGLHAPAISKKAHIV